MKNSMTYYLSCVGLSGIIITQLLQLIQAQQILIWPSILLVAALIPIKGFIANHRYTFQWTGFLALFFLCVGVSEFFVVATPSSSSFLMLCSSVVLYFGVVFHAKKLGVLENLVKAD